MIPTYITCVQTTNDPIYNQIFSQSKLEHFREEMNDWDWSEVINEEASDNTYRYFLTKIKLQMELIFPEKKFSLKRIAFE